MTEKSHVSTYHPFIQRQADAQPMSLSYLAQDWPNASEWAAAGRAKMAELLAYDPQPCPPNAQVLESVQRPGFVRHLIRFNVTADRTTDAYLLVPDGLNGPAPTIMALHDHGGFYYYGKEKSCQTENIAPIMWEFANRSYGGQFFGDELARQGFVVFVPDAFYFGSQRLSVDHLALDFADELNGLTPDTDEYVAKFNALANQHETLVAKTLFTSGTTWPGVLFQGDRAALDYLVTRPEVDQERIGCAGLSIGGFRSAHLFGLDPRIKAGVVAGWMTTYGSLLFDHLRYHTWMIYVPRQLQWLDLPDVATLNAPRPLMVINCIKDALFTMDGMQAAEKKIAEVYERMDAAENFHCRYDDEPHSLKPPAQDAAIQWLKKHL